jgi:hypothetical protein
VGASGVEPASGHPWPDWSPFSKGARGSGKATPKGSSPFGDYSPGISLRSCTGAAMRLRRRMLIISTANEKAIAK